MEDNCVVSILCATYNHEKYIRQTIESFLAQRTNFNFEILVHDDASTDGTADVIRQLASEYPDKIFPIFQAENQYSKGVVVLDVLLKNAKGKYVAICEGDDYWTDPYKLQMQVEWLENHPDYSSCVHNTKVINCENESEYLYNRKDSEDRDFTLEDVLLHGVGQTFHTSSMLVRMRYFSHKPAFYYISMTQHIGDFPMAIWFAINGKIRFINKTMSVYRQFSAPSSWSVRIREASFIENRLVTGIEMFEAVKSYIKQKFDAPYIYIYIIDDALMRYRWELLQARGEYMQMKKPPYDVLFRVAPMKQRLWINFKLYCPTAYCILMELRGRESSIPEKIKNRKNL